MSDRKNMNHISIDFEYHVNEDKSLTPICVALYDEATQKTVKLWLRDNSGLPLLKRILLHHREDSILICHAMELAEARVFKTIGLNPCDFKWRDTWLEARLLDNSFFLPGRVPSYSLVECCRKYLGVERDEDVKQEMRNYCILDTTAGHEQEIMDYCADDVKDLLDLANVLLDKYMERVSKMASIRDVCRFSEDTLVGWTYAVNCSSEIAERGLPVDNDTVEAIRQKAPEAVRKLKIAFEAKYPGSFNFSVLKKTATEKISKSMAGLNAHMEKFVESIGAKNTWAKSEKTGKWSLDSGLLKDYKGTECFAGDLYRLQKNITALQGLVSERADKNWLRNWSQDEGRLAYGSLCPFRSATGRFQPRPSEGFVPGWAHWLYCVLNPRKGRMLFEIDFHAEETALQAIITHDSAYAEIYKAKDTYLWIGMMLGVIPKEDYESMPVKELKKKYHAERGYLKTFFLAWSYGAGATHLAQIAKIPVEKSKKWVNDLNNRVFKVSTQWKHRILDATDPVTGKFHTLALPDGFQSRCHKTGREEKKPDTTKMNFPFQGFGAYLLRELVKRCHEQDIYVVCTIHDALLFECDEGDMEAVKRANDLMITTSRELLGSDLLEVGAPAFWHNHTLKDIREYPVRGEYRDESAYLEDLKAAQTKVGDLVEPEDVEKFKKLVLNT